jgi:hypothetical protein
MILPRYVQNDHRDAWDRLRRRLAWAHGETRAALILAGLDDATNADLAAWRALGRGR